MSFTQVVFNELSHILEIFLCTLILEKLHIFIHHSGCQLVIGLKMFGLTLNILWKRFLKGKLFLSEKSVLCCQFDKLLCIKDNVQGNVKHLLFSWLVGDEGNTLKSITTKYKRHKYLLIFGKYVWCCQYRKMWHVAPSIEFFVSIYLKSEKQTWWMCEIHELILCMI